MIPSGQPFLSEHHIQRHDLTHRDDIDGLRAVAVLAVVLYHAKIFPFTGGYVGVDVFFVISGFLITSILLPEIREGRLGLGHFYERRIRRIFPALFVVMGACFIAAWWLFLPSQIDRLAHSAIAATFFFSNVFFRTEAETYFAAQNQFSPLLHTWSLAIEEQFYIVYPILLFLAFRLLKAKAPAAIALAAIVSFAVAAWAVGAHPQGVFYRTSMRTWELLLGALLAIDILPAPTSRLTREIATVAGGGLIYWSVFAFDSETVFPGATALFPCIGTAMIIYAGIGGPSFIRKILESWPFIRIGWMSYSLYLWHWPILVFCRQYFVGANLSRTVTIAAVVASFAVSWLSWRFVEEPFRERDRFRRRTIFSLAAAAVAASLSLGTFILAEAGLPGRLPPDVVDLASAARDYDLRRAACVELEPSSVRKGALCRIGAAGSDPPSFVLWGDSHAGALMPVVDASAKRHGLTGAIVGRSACPPLLGANIQIPSFGEKCREFSDAAMDYLRSVSSVDTVILAGRWALYAEGTPYGVEPIAPFSITDDQTSSPCCAENRRVFIRSLERTVTALKRAGKHVIIVGPVPEIGWEVPKWLAIQRLMGHKRPIAPTRHDFTIRQDFVLDELKRLSRWPDLTVIYPHKALCGAETCAITDGVHPYYIDDDHLSVHGALAISSIFDPVMEAMAVHRH